MNPKIQDDILMHLAFIYKQMEHSQHNLRLAVNRLELLQCYMDDITRYEHMVDMKIGITGDVKDESK